MATTWRPSAALLALGLGLAAACLPLPARADKSTDAKVSALVTRGLDEYRAGKLTSPPGDNVNDTLNQIQGLLKDTGPDGWRRVQELYATIKGRPAEPATKPDAVRNTSAAPTAPPPAAKPLPNPAPAPDVGPFLIRGDAAMGLHQTAVAREWYRFAAEKGSSEGALRMAQTYDPEFLKQHGAIGIPGDPDQEKSWLARAQQLKDQR